MSDKDEFDFNFDDFEAESANEGGDLNLDEMDFGSSESAVGTEFNFDDPEAEAGGPAKGGASEFNLDDLDFEATGTDSSGSSDMDFGEFDLEEGGETQTASSEMSFDEAADFSTEDFGGGADSGDEAGMELDLEASAETLENVESEGIDDFFESSEETEENFDFGDTGDELDLDAAGSALESPTEGLDLESDLGTDTSMEELGDLPEMGGELGLDESPGLDGLDLEGDFDTGSFDDMDFNAEGGAAFEEEGLALDEEDSSGLETWEEETPTSTGGPVAFDVGGTAQQEDGLETEVIGGPGAFEEEDLALPEEESLMSFEDSESESEGGLLELEETEAAEPLELSADDLLTEEENFLSEGDELGESPDFADAFSTESDLPTNFMADELGEDGFNLSEDTLSMPEDEGSWAEPATALAAGALAAGTLAMTKAGKHDQKLTKAEATSAPKRAHVAPHSVTLDEAPMTSSISLDSDELDSEPMLDHQEFEDSEMAFEDEEDAMPSMGAPGTLPGLRRAGGAGERNVGAELLLNVGHDLVVEVGRARLTGAEITEITYGSVIELNKIAGDPVDLVLDGKVVAYGEVVQINKEKLGIRIIGINQTRK